MLPVLFLNASNIETTECSIRKGLSEGSHLFILSPKRYNSFIVFP